MERGWQVTRETPLRLCRYKDDPTIFAWNLINEPRCSKCVPAFTVHNSKAGTCIIPEHHQGITDPCQVASRMLHLSSRPACLQQPGGIGNCTWARQSKVCSLHTQ